MLSDQISSDKSTSIDCSQSQSKHFRNTDVNLCKAIDIIENLEDTYKFKDMYIDARKICETMVIESPYANKKGPLKGINDKFLQKAKEVKSIASKSMKSNQGPEKQDFDNRHCKQTSSF